MKKLLLLIFIVLLFAVSFYGIYFSKINKGLSAIGENVSFEIKPGEGVKKISLKLEESKLISSALFFELYIWETKSETRLQAGHYELNPKMSISEIVQKIIDGEVLSQEKNIKLLEGWGIKDMEDYLAKNSITNKNDFSAKVSESVDNWLFGFKMPDFLETAPKTASLEGYLFPDTYRIFNYASADDIVFKMLENFDKKLNQDLRAEIKKQNKSIHDIIIMASIIEKEVRSPRDMAIVAGILYNRMKIGMRLEVDSSVNFASGKNDPGVSLEDLQIDSPYNTYKYNGLPPGPICSPGIEAIKAAIYPQESPYLFYLNRQDTGETIFSKNFEEHVRNKNKYLK